MNSQETFTAEEVAKLLKITKNTVYEIVKRGELPSYKVGKKLRIDKVDVDEYINNQKVRPKGNIQYNIIQGELYSPQNEVKIQSETNVQNDIIIAGQDSILDSLVDKINERVTDTRVLRSNLGSYTSLVNLYMDKISVCSVHLWDGDTDEYNIAYVRKLLPGIPCIVINLAYRMMGFYVAKGNPHNIKTWNDLTKPNISIVNREKGSGTRILLDEKLRLLNIQGQSINGYNEERNTHLSVASSIARGEGDVGLGSEKIALQVAGIDFVPIQEEQYDIVIKNTSLNNPIYKLIVDVIKSDEFKKELQGIGGYNLKNIGKILAKT